MLYLAAEAKPGSTWHKIVATVPVALDTRHTRNWLDTQRYGLPKLPDGTPVEESAYLRIAWMKEGLLLLVENPLGVGFGRNAFGHALQRKYGEGQGHSHSGILDLALGIGIPGALLWVGFVVWQCRTGLVRFQRGQGYFGLALFFVSLDFGLRMFVDSNIRDHMLQQYLFLAGFLGALSAKAPPAALGEEKRAL